MMPRLAPVTAMQLVKKYRPDSSIRWNSSWLQLIHSCIIDTVIPHHLHGDRNASAGINCKTGAYNCFTWSDHSISFRELCKILHEDYDFESETVIKDDDFGKAIKEKFAPQTKEYKLNLDIYSTAHHWYMTDIRGFSDNVLDIAGIRYDQYTGRIVIPIWEASTSNERKLVGIQKRRIQDPSIDGNHYQKYENDKGFVKTDHVYAIEKLDLSKPLMVVESTMSVLKAWDYGIKNCCSVLGSHLSRYQTDFLKQFPELMLALDGDMSGMRGTRSLLKKLNGSQVRILDNHCYGSDDIADIGRNKTFELIMSSLTPFQWTEKYSKAIDQWMRQKIEAKKAF